MGNGARQIRDALHDLDERGFIAIVQVETGSNEIQLLSELGTGAAYSPPNPTENERYMRLPRKLWADGWIAEMSGRALSTYVAVMANSGWQDQPFWLAANHFHELYGMGETTRKKGFSELVNIGALDVTAKSTTKMAGMRTFRRNVYTLRPDLSSGPAQPQIIPIPPIE
jgi:hypothetical protein